MKRPDQIKTAPDQGMGDRVPPGQFLTTKFPVLTYGAEPQIEVEGVGGLSELSEPGNRKGSGTPRGRKGSPGRSASPRGSSPRGSSPRGGKKESSKKGPAAKLKGMSRKK